MVRHKQPAASPYRMYRHFAAVTLVITAALAILSDGRQREALAGELAEREQRNQLEKASQEKFGKPKLIKKAPQQTSGRFGSDSGTFGEPMDNPGGSGTGYVPEALAWGDSAPASYNRYGLTEAQWAALSEDERAALRGQAAEEARQAATPERRGQIDALRAASAARAGTAGTSD